jgi:SET domain-containing protein
MLLVKTKIQDSNICGAGLFSCHKIKKGSPVWQLHKKTTSNYLKSEFIEICSELSIPCILDLIDNSYVRSGMVYTHLDNSKFIQHSHKPNIAFLSDGIEVALRDIEEGEEFLENYNVSYDSNDLSFFVMPTPLSKENIISSLKELLLDNEKDKRNFLIN